MSRLKLVTIQVVLLSAISCFAAELNPQNEQQREAVSRETAQNWIQVGILQTKKGLYDQAEKSFLAAKEYQVYLTAEEQKNLDKNLAEARQGAAERQTVLEHVKQARELLSQKQPIKARAQFEKVRNSPYLTELERKEIDKEIKKADSELDKQRKEITDIYNRSVQLYRAGEIEKAREGFVEVAKYGKLVVPKGQTAEDYLIQIDSILTERLKRETVANEPVTQASPAESAAENESPKTKNINKGVSSENEVMLLKSQSGQAGAESKTVEEPQVNKPMEEEQETLSSTEPDKEARTKVAREYIKAVIEDAAAKVENDIQQGDFDRAVNVVRSAAEVVKENRALIGNELFTQSSDRLKQLADKIIQARKSS